MKKISYLTMAVTFITLASCQKNESNPEPAKKVEDTFVAYKGETVRLPAGVSEEALGKDFQGSIEFFKSTYLQESNARVDGNGLPVLDITEKEALDVISKEMSKYALTKLKGRKDTNSVTQEAFSAIKKDFPKISNRKEIFEKGDIVFSYYNDLLRNDVQKKFGEIMKSKKGGRTEGLYDNLNPRESACVSAYPFGAWCMNLAADKSELCTINVWGANNGGDYTDAFRHSTWNAFAVSRMMDWFMSCSTALNTTMQFASAHEYDKATGSYLVKDIDSAMDLHNNMVGRYYMEANTGWGIWFIRSSPSDQDIINYFVNKINSGSILYVNSPNTILSFYALNDPNTAWIRLELWEWDAQNNLVKIR